MLMSRDGQLGFVDLDARGFLYLDGRMRPANPRLVIARAAALGIAALGCWSLVACAKTPTAGAQAEAATGAHEVGGRAPTPRRLPPEVKPLYDKLDDLGKKVFIRVASSESSVCGDAQSLINSVKTCRRSVAAPALRRQADRAGVHRLGDLREAGEPLPPGRAPRRST